MLGNHEILSSSTNKETDPVYLLQSAKRLDEATNFAIKNHQDLHLASQNGNTEAVKLLLKQEGIDINKGNKYGWTPLHLAAQNEHKNIIKLLLIL